MMKKALFNVALIGALLLLQHGAYAQGSDDGLLGLNNGGPDNGVLNGRYRFQTAGQAQLSAPTSGSCVATGLVAAALNGVVRFDGQGNFNEGNMAISIGATSCTEINYFIFGNYNVTSNDGNTFAATGTLSTGFQGRLAGCAGTSLTGVPFSLVGTIQTHSIAIETTGGGGSYAEGPDGTTTCRATILNLITSGQMALPF